MLALKQAPWKFWTKQRKWTSSSVLPLAETTIPRFTSVEPVTFCISLQGNPEILAAGTFTIDAKLMVRGYKPWTIERLSIDQIFAGSLDAFLKIPRWFLFYSLGRMLDSQDIDNNNNNSAATDSKPGCERRSDGYLQSEWLLAPAASQGVGVESAGTLQSCTLFTKEASYKM